MQAFLASFLQARARHADEGIAVKSPTSVEGMLLSTYKQASVTSARKMLLMYRRSDDTVLPHAPLDVNRS